MQINVIIEPEYRDTIWCNETLRGIDQKAASLRYVIEICTIDTIDAALKSIIIVGTSPNWVSAVLDKASLFGIHSIVISCQPIETKENTGYVLIDHNSATKECIEYLNCCNRNKIALFGINCNSYADMIKTKYFDDEDIYYIPEKNALQDCYRNFANDVKKYNSVVCSNYITAIYLMTKLKQQGTLIPEDIYVVAFGDSVIGNLFKPSLTTITLNHRQLGIQAVNLCRFSDILSYSAYATVYVSCEICVANSTDNTPFTKSDCNPKHIFSTDYVFTEDEQIREIQSLEKLLELCDATDFKIIENLLSKKTYGTIGDLLYISESSVKYRIKRLLNSSGIESNSKMLKIYEKYIGGKNE